MNETQRYFIELLSSHLNNTTPPTNRNIKWSDIFKLGELQNLTGIIALEINKLPDEYQPNAKGKSYFKQALGQTVQSADLKYRAIDNMMDILSNAGINHTVIKGGAIRHLFPVPELRTSGDTDVVIDENDKNKIKQLLLDNSFELESESVNQLVIKHLNQEFQFKTYFDCISKDDRAYFSLDLCDNVSGTTYFLKPNYHTLYVINHFLKHLKGGGVGLRQLMDIDVLLRNEEIDIDLLIDNCKVMGIEKSAKAVIALSKRLFDTPIEFDYEIDDNTFEHLTGIMLDGGVFGYGISDIGTVRLAKQGSKIKAIISMLFATKEYMYNTYIYANNHHFLLPLAYIQRFFDAVFKRGKQNRKNLKSILTNDENANLLAQISKELEI